MAALFDEFARCDLDGSVWLPHDLSEAGYPLRLMLAVDPVSG